MSLLPPRKSHRVDNTKRSRQSQNNHNNNNVPRGRLGHLIPRLWLRSSASADAPPALPMTSLSAVKFRNFEDMLKKLGDSIVVVSFTADLCGPCRIMKKELNLVSTKLGNEVKMITVDTNKFPKLGQRYNVAVLPTIFVFIKGEIHDRIDGVEKAGILVERLQRLLSVEDTEE